MNYNKFLTKWEVKCIVINSLIYKTLSGYTQNFIKCGGSAAWINSLFVGIVFLLMLRFLLFLKPKVSVNKRLKNFVSVFAVIYFVFSAFAAVKYGCRALKLMSYEYSPMVFIAVFFVVAGVTITLLGEKAVLRIHSLTMIGSVFAVVSINFLSLRYSEIYRLFPVFGKGVKSIFVSGFKNILLYADIAAIFFLPVKKGAEKTIINSARFAVLINTLSVFAVSLSISDASQVVLPLYSLTKTAEIGKLSLKLDAMYQIAVIVSGIIYVALALSVAFKCAKSALKKHKRIYAATLSVLLCIVLCGCADGREVEENAYVIAVGIDKGEKYEYTFQISNPLKSGGENGEDKEAENKSAYNITIEADSFYSAENKLKSVLTKEISLSHLRLIVFSNSDGVLSDNRDFLKRERFVRPGTNLCIATSANDFLRGVVPVLEETTVRYYELFFKNNKLPFAPVTQMRDFADRCIETGEDAVVPIVKDGSLEGMGVFSNGAIVYTANGYETALYKLARGELKNYALYGESSISNKGKPKILIKEENGKINVEIKVKLKIENGEISSFEDLQGDTEEFLNTVYNRGSDILGIGKRLKKRFLTDEQWENFKWREKIKDCVVKIDILV